MRIDSFLRFRGAGPALGASLVLAGFPILPRAAAAPFRPSPVRTAAPAPVIVDTDAGIDDMLALAFLLGRRDVHIEAITVVNGLCHVPDGVSNILRFLQLAGHPEIPVYAGSTSPLSGNAAFPAAWRKDTDTLPGVTLPTATVKPQAESAKLSSSDASEIAIARREFWRSVRSRTSGLSFGSSPGQPRPSKKS